MHYEGDLRVGAEQAHRLFVALERQSTPTALVIFPDEAHGMTRSGRLDRRIERYRQLEAWFARFL